MKKRSKALAIIIAIVIFLPVFSTAQRNKTRTQISLTVRLLSDWADREFGNSNWPGFFAENLISENLVYVYIWENSFKKGDLLQLQGLWYKNDGVQAHMFYYTDDFYTENIPVFNVTTAEKITGLEIEKPDGVIKKPAKKKE